MRMSTVVNTMVLIPVASAMRAATPWIPMPMADSLMTR